ncbi:transketolase family protein [Thermodesulfobacteriota bacterium]
MDARVMRDVFIEKLYDRMLSDESIFFISADFGAPALDKLREDFPDRFVNVGIAEQNLINIATGLALESYNVYAYAIAPFLSMRAYEQIRTNLSILSQVRQINVNLIGVGAGLSYDVTGPTHHCLEDSCIMTVLPNFVVFSPSDCVLIENFLDFSLQHKCPKYIRLDGKAQPDIYSDNETIIIANGFYERGEGSEVGIVSTGYMTHVALKTARQLNRINISSGVIDVFLLKPINEKLLIEKLSKYKHIVTMEESFINKGSLDSIIDNILVANRLNVGLTKFGFDDKYVFDVGNRDHLHKVNGLSQEDIIEKIKADLNLTK